MTANQVAYAAVLAEEQKNFETAQHNRRMEYLQEEQNALTAQKNQWDRDIRLEANSIQRDLGDRRITADIGISNARNRLDKYIADNKAVNDYNIALEHERQANWRFKNEFNQRKEQFNTAQENAWNIEMSKIENEKQRITNDYNARLYAIDTQYEASKYQADKQAETATKTAWINAGASIIGGAVRGLVPSLRANSVGGASKDPGRAGYPTPREVAESLFE